MKKYLIKTLLFGFALTLATPAIAVDQKAEVQAAFKKWQDALTSGKPENLVALYTADAVVFAAASRKPLLSTADRQSYFADLAKIKGLKLEAKENLTQVFGDVAINSGTINFTSKDLANKSVSMLSRYTFVYQKQPQGWLIVNQHSSLLPDAPTAAVPKKT